MHDHAQESKLGSLRGAARTYMRHACLCGPSVVAWLGACQVVSESEPTGPIVDLDYVHDVIGFAPGANTDLGHAEMPDVVMEPPDGQVVALGCGGDLTVDFGRDLQPWSDGPEIAVFGPGRRMADTDGAGWAEVAVSVDGVAWSAFDCDAATGTGCAGGTEARLDEAPDPNDLEASGAALFDLDDLLGAKEALRYVRLRDRGTATNLASCSDPEAGAHVDTVGAIILIPRG